MAFGSGARFGAAYVELDAHMHKLEAAMNKTRMLVDKRMGQMQTRLNAIQPTMDKIGKYGMRAFMILGPAIAGATFKAAQFEKQMAQVSTMLSRHSMPILDRYKTKLHSMTVEFGDSSKSLSKGLYDILSASVAPEKAIAVLNASAIAAVAGVTDTGVAADAVTTMLNSYSLAAKNAADVTDWFFSVIQRGKTTFPEMAAGVGKVAALAHSAGITVEEFGASLATMTRAGLSTDIALTSLKSILTMFLSPAEQSITAAKEFSKQHNIAGFALNTSALKAKGWLQVLKDLSKATPEQTAAIFSNVRALTGLSTMLENVEGVEYDLLQITDRGGKAWEAYEKQAASAAFKVGQLKEALGGLAGAFGSIFVPAVGRGAATWADKLEEMSKGIRGMESRTRDYVVEGTKMTVGLAAIAILLPKLTKMAAGFAGAIGLLAKAHPFLLLAGGAVTLTAVLYKLLEVQGREAVANMERVQIARAETEEVAELTKKIKELGDKTERTAAEKSELDRLISSLKEKFPGLNVLYDTAGKRIGVMADELERLNREQRRSFEATWAAEQQKNLESVLKAQNDLEQLRKEQELQRKQPPSTRDFSSIAGGPIQGELIATSDGAYTYRTEQAYREEEARLERHIKDMKALMVRYRADRRETLGLEPLPGAGPPETMPAPPPGPDPEEVAKGIQKIEAMVESARDRMLKATMDQLDYRKEKNKEEYAASKEYLEKAVADKTASTAQMNSILEDMEETHLAEITKMEEDAATRAAAITARAIDLKKQANAEAAQLEELHAQQRQNALTVCAELQEEVGENDVEWLDAKVKLLGYQVELYEKIAKKAEAAGELEDMGPMIKKWAEFQSKLLEQEKAKRGEDFFAGWEARLEQMGDGLTTLGELGFEAFDGMAGAMDSTFGSFVDDAFAGELDSAEDYFKSFLQSMMKSWADSLAKMAAEQAAAGLGKMLLGGAVKSGLSGMLGGVLGAFGFGGAAAGSGGWVGGVPSAGGGGGGILLAAKGGVYDRPTLLGIAEKPGLTEAVVPMPGGKAIPVQMSGGGSNLTINRGDTNISMEGATIIGDEDWQEHMRAVAEVTMRDSYDDDAYLRQIIRAEVLRGG